MTTLNNARLTQKILKWTLCCLLVTFPALSEAQPGRGQQDPEQRIQRQMERIRSVVTDLSEEQSEQLTELYRDFSDQQQVLYRRAQETGDRASAMKRLRELRGKLQQSILQVLTLAQREVYRSEVQETLQRFRQAPSREDLPEPGTISGVVVDDEDGAYLRAANIILRKPQDSVTVRLEVTDTDGQFKFSNLEIGAYLLEIRHVAYRTTWKEVLLRRRGIDLGDIRLDVREIVLDEVTTTGKMPPAIQKGDTVQYNAAAYKTLPDASAEDLVTKMPGIIVENGTVSAQGEEVQRVLVDGREFFGDDPNIALRNLPAEVIEKIEVFDRLSDQSQFTGFDDGNTEKTINIVTREDMRNGEFGKIYGGGGTDQRYQAGGNINWFSGDTRLALIGLTNNINQQNFSTQDLLGVVSSGNTRTRTGMGRGRGGGGMRGNSGRSPNPGRFGAGGSANNFLVGNQNGISTTHSLGVNFNDSWGERISFTGSYFFNAADNLNQQALNRQYLFADDVTQFYDEENRNDSRNLNNRLNFRLTYQIDERNSILLTPRLSFQSYDGLSDLSGNTYLNDTANLNRSVNQYDVENSGYNFSNNLLYRHRFEKARRTFSVNIRTTMNGRKGENDLLAVNEYFQPVYSYDSLNQLTDLPSGGYTLATNFAYTEPVGSSAMLQVNLSSNYSDSYSDRRTYNFNETENAYNDLDTALSNEFQNDYWQNRGGLTYRSGSRQKMFMVGINYQQADLINDQSFPVSAGLEKTFRNLLPMAMFRKQLPNANNLMVMYRTTTNAPSINQLQNVVDNSNPILLSSGNPDLQQEYTHQIVSRYSANNMDKMSTFFVFLVLRNTQNKINNATYVSARDTTIAGIDLAPGVQLNLPVNVDGYWNARTFVTYGIPAGWLRSNLNLNGGINYTRAPGISQGVQNISNTYGINQSTVLASNISDYLDFTLSYNATYNIVRNEIQPTLNNDYLSLNGNIKLNWIFWKGFVLRNQLVYQRFDGLTDEFNQRYTLWNLSLGKKLFKNQLGELQLTVFDLLNQNRAITRNVTETYIEDLQYDLVRRYLMLSFIYNLRNFRSDKNR